MTRFAQSQSSRILKAVVGLSVFIVPLLLSPAHAQGTEPRNIIVIMADDLEFNDLPFFGNEPIQWDHQNDPKPGAPDLTSAESPQFGEARRRLPGLNRLVARMFADSGGKLGTYPDASGFKVVPGDLDEAGGDPDVSSFTYAPVAACQKKSVSEFRNGCTETVASTDILSNYGGLASLAGANSVTFPRFYANSAVCAPTRGAFMTGRSHVRLGMKKFSSGLDSEEITIAEFLKQGCGLNNGERSCIDWGQDPPVFKKCHCYLDQNQTAGYCANIDTNAACYTTGAIGKWGIGNAAKSPWRQGFDEYIGFLGANRDYMSLGKIPCSPDTQRYCNLGDQDGQPCLSDNDCTGTINGTCSPEPGFMQATPTGLYIGSDPNYVNECISTQTSQKGKVDPLCCEPRDTNDKALGRYHFEKKEHSPGVRVFFKEGRQVSPAGDDALHCSDDAPVTTTGCAYYTRVIRDHASDFILRHKNDEPFFLFISFNAIHKPKKAPARTLAHYKRKKNSDDFKTKKALNPLYLAMTEELDAAVDKILETLTTAALTKPTLAMFVADQGQGRKYGNPNLAGGKGTVMEGGIRIGMMARDTDLFSAAAKVISDDRIGGMVDFFPTIAQAAGYDDPNFGSGVNGLFDANWQIEVALTTESGNKKRVDGTSLIPIMTDDVAGTRDFIYADYFKDTYTIVTREGHYLDAKCGGNADCDYAAKVCGYESAVRTDLCTTGLLIGNSCENNADCGVGETCGPDNRAVRFVRGGSCTACIEGVDCTSPAKECKILGGVCLDKNDNQLITFCTDTNLTTACDVDTFPRCHEDKDCPTINGVKHGCYDDFVQPIIVACTGCFPATWKYRNKGDEKKGRPRFTDLRTNPEESGILECYDGGCDPGTDELCKVQEDLDDLLCHWQACVSKKMSACSDDDLCEGPLVDDCSDPVCHVP